MKKQPVFLSEQGITQTSANYLANLANELIKEDEQALKNVSFLNRNVELITGTKKELNRGLISFNSIPEYINRIAEMHAFNAYMREAIKAKESYVEESISFDEYASKFGIELPKRPELSMITENDVLESWNLKKRNEYFSIEAFASTYGKYIHENGAISSAREIFLERIVKPNVVSGEGRDMVIYSYTPSIAAEDLNDGYIKLQSQYRDYERRLNALKYEIKETISKHAQEARAKHTKEIQEYNKIIQEYESQFSEWLEIEFNRRAKLKIIVPDRLKSIYEYLESK